MLIAPMIRLTITWDREEILTVGRPGPEREIGSRAAEIRLVLELGADGGFDLVFCSSPTRRGRPRLILAAGDTG